MNRKKLKSLVSLMFAFVIIGFVYVLFSSLGTPKDVESSGENYFDINSGQTVMRRVDGQRAWITKLSKQQTAQSKFLRPHLVDPNSGCNSHKSLCALLAVVSDNGLELTYSVLPPPQLERDDLWIGGFVDPTTGAIFDLLGRAYRLNRSSDVQTLLIIDLDKAL